MLWKRSKRRALSFQFHSMKANLFILFGALSSLGVIAAAALTPVTDQNRVPMTLSILAGGLAVPALCAVAASRELGG